MPTQDLAQRLFGISLDEAGRFYLDTEADWKAPRHMVSSTGWFDDIHLKIAASLWGLPIYAYQKKAQSTTQCLIDRLNGLEWHPVKLAAFPLTISLARYYA